MRLQTLGSIVAGLLLAAAPLRAEVSVSIAQGHVTISAHDATLRQILTEWARVGRTRIVNADRLAGPPVSLELTDVPEAQALDTLLRSVSGYLAAPRAAVLPNASQYDRIFLLPTSTGTPVRATASQPAPPSPAAPPVFAQPDDDAVGDGARRRVVQPNAPPANGQPNGGPERPPVSPFAQPQFRPSNPDGPPPGPPQTSTAPTTPVGVARPGMLVPVPPGAQQPGQQNPAPNDQPR